MAAALQWLGCMMLAFRTLTLGTLGACLFFMAGVVRQVEPLAEVQLAEPTPAVAPTIVDIASGVPRDRLASLITLAPGERVIAVGERAVGSELEAGAAIAEASPSPGEFIDLTVEGASGPRRVLVLVH